MDGVNNGAMGLPDIVSIVRNVRFVGSPLHSRALMPKGEVRGKRLAL